MEWLNIHRSTVEGEAMQDATAEEVRTWLFLSIYCAGQENAGRIAGAATWNDRKWLKLCGLEKPGQHAKLWHWDGEDLMVEFYPKEQEAFIRDKRRAGKAGGKKRVENLHRREAHLKAPATHVPEAELEAQLESELQRKGREGKEKKGKEREEAPADEVLIPTEAEVRTWAELSGVHPDFAAQKWASTRERHAWVANGQLIDWPHRFKRYWEEDKVQWLERYKKTGPTRAGQFQKNGAHGEKPAGWKEGDVEWWWTEGLDLIEKTFHGTLMAGEADRAARLKEILKIRKDAPAG